MVCDIMAKTRRQQPSVLQALRMIYDENKVDEEAGVLHTFEDLAAVALHGDRLKHRMTAWGIVVAYQEEITNQSTPYVSCN